MVLFMISVAVLVLLMAVFIYVLVSFLEQTQYEVRVPMVRA